MAKIVFVNPSINFKRSFGRLAPFMEPAPCIGLARLATLMKQAGHKVYGVDAYCERLTTSEASEIISTHNPDIVGISCLTASAPWVKDLIHKLKDLRLSARIVLGSLHASLFAEEFILSDGVDVVVHGEGEETFCELVPKLLSDSKLDDVRGISFKSNGSMIKTEERPLIADLDRLPYPDWGIFNYKNYGLLPFVTMGKPALMIEGSRGCPYSCSFCALGWLGGKYRMRSIPSIVDEFEYSINNFGAKQIAFADAMFPLTQKQGLEFCAEIIKRRLEKKCIWVTETRVDIITRPLVKAMREAGCRRILFGIESGAQAVLNGIGKKIDLGKTIEVIKICQEEKLQTCGFFILGLPGEDRPATEETISFALKLPLDLAKFNIAIPYPGSPMYREALENGRLLHRNWEDYSCYGSDPNQLPWLPEGRQAKELISKQKTATRRFYLRPGMILKHIFIIRTIGLKFMLLGGWILISEGILGLFQNSSLKIKTALLKSKNL